MIKIDRNFFYPDITIHTPIESPSRVYSKYVVLRNIYSDVWFKKPIKSIKYVFFNVDLNDRVYDLFKQKYESFAYLVSRIANWLFFFLQMHFKLCILREK